DAAFFFHQMGKRGRQQSSSGIAADRDTPGIDTQCRRVIEYPAQCRGGVVQRRRPFVFGGKTVFHRDDTKAALVCEEAAKPIMRVEIADHEAAAMEIDQCRHRRAASRNGSIGAGPDIALRSRDLEILDLAARNILWAHQAHHAGKAFAQGAERHLPRLWAWDRRRLIEKGFHQRIEGHAVLRKACEPPCYRNERAANTGFLPPQGGAFGGGRCLLAGLPAWQTDGGNLMNRQRPVWVEPVAG